MGAGPTQLAPYGAVWARFARGVLKDWRQGGCRSEWCGNGVGLVLLQPITSMIVVTAKKGKIRLNARKDCSIGVNAAPPIITRGQRKKFHSASMPLPSPQRLLSDEQTFAESPRKLILFAEGVDVVTG